MWVAGSLITLRTFHGVLVLGQALHAAPVTRFPSLGITGTRLYSQLIRRTMLNTKLERVHKLLSYAYFFFVGFGILMVVPGLVRGDDRYGFGLVCIFCIGPIGLIHWYAAKGAQAGKRWGRNLSRVIGTFLLLGFPLWTAFGVYILSQTGNKKWQGSSP